MTPVIKIHFLWNGKKRNDLSHLYTPKKIENSVLRHKIVQRVLPILIFFRRDTHLAETRRKLTQDKNSSYKHSLHKNRKALKLR